METPTKQVVIACAGNGTLPLERFEPFQGELKKLGKTEHEQLRNEILTQGFSFPVSVWLHDGHAYLLDGHQRVRVLTALREEGYEIPEIPFDPIEAESHTQAKAKLLGAASEYGRITDSGLHEFMKTSGLETADVIKRFALPAIDLQKFSEKFGASGSDSGDLGQTFVDPSKDPAAAKLPSSHVRMVQLFFNEETHAEFLNLTARLDQHYAKGNLTDTILEVVRADFATRFPNG